ncbi:hypothetical protein MOU86_004587 [Vibrio parahaemolyticus]|nr:hypothetical protein [Vibrio parahaemolyticus]
MKKALKEYYFIVFSFLVLIGVSGVSISLFFTKFSGELSGQQEDWGAFGSYLSGTVGVLAACLAVIWLMKSVHLQKIELAHLKNELANSAEEQRKQTHISALSALISSSRQAVSEYQQDLIALNTGDKHTHPLLSDIDMKMAMDDEQRKIFFYQKQLESYLKEQYVDPYKEKQDLAQDNDIPF